MTNAAAGVHRRTRQWAVWPFDVWAQQPTMRVIGYLNSTTEASTQRFIAAFRQGLSELGYVENQNVAIE
jgi:putative ABC transport system substrate-binding protein